MNIRFVVFHAGSETLPVYLPLMRVGRAALAETNPGARYVVLTDKETAPYLDTEFEVEALAPSNKPLMVQFVIAQRDYEKAAEPGLVVLAGTDCAAINDLSTALQHNMAVTYRPRGRYLINNVAYIEDHDRAAWFLDRAMHLMDRKALGWFGDQQAWQAALGPPNSWELIAPDGKEDSARMAKPDGRFIALYPCRSHNWFDKGHKFPIDNSKVYLVHFKGAGKRHMVNALTEHLLGRNVVQGTTGGQKWRRPAYLSVVK